MSWGPAHRLVTPRLVLRPPDPTRAAEVLDAIEESLESLRATMTWAEHEPESVEEKARRLRGGRARFHEGLDLTYGIYRKEDDVFLGNVSAQARCGAGGRELGYWIRTSAEGQGLVSEAAAAVTRAALSDEATWRIEVCHGPDNDRSAGIPRRLGFRRDAVLRARKRWVDGSLRDTVVWSLLRDELAGSPVTNVEVEATDVSGRELELAG
ncbi:MAG: GNAT family protein [Acidobacteriota bacterium]